MTETKLDRGVIFALRVLVGWTFLRQAPATSGPRVTLARRRPVAAGQPAVPA